MFTVSQRILCVLRSSCSNVPSHARAHIPHPPTRSPSLPTLCYFPALFLPCGRPHTHTGTTPDLVMDQLYWLTETHLAAAAAKLDNSLRFTLPAGATAHVHPHLRTLDWQILSHTSGSELTLFLTPRKLRSLMTLILIVHSPFCSGLRLCHARNVNLRKRV